MEMSFLEDLLKRDVDQNQVNALVGSLENQLSNTPTSNLTSSSKTTVDIKPNITAPQQVPVPPPRTTANSNTSSAGYVRYAKTPPVQQTPASSSHKNGSAPFNNPKLMASSASQQQTTVLRNNVMNRVGSPKLSGVPPGSSAIVTTVNSVTTPQVSIAPKIISNAVPIAPRIATNIGTNIMITPRHAQILMSRHLGPNAALLQGNLIAQMPGGLPVVPRIPGGAIAVPPIMNTQIPAGIRPVVGPRGGNLINMGQRQKVVPRMAALTAQLPGTSLARSVKPNASILPGQVNYRFRQVNPNSVLSA